MLLIKVCTKGHLLFVHNNISLVFTFLIVEQASSGQQTVSSISTQTQPMQSQTAPSNSLAEIQAQSQTLQANPQTQSQAQSLPSNSQSQAHTSSNNLPPPNTQTTGRVTRRQMTIQNIKPPPKKKRRI